MKILYFDLETTGTMFWKNGIHQLAGCIEIDGIVVEKFDYNVQPYHKAQINDEALSIAGITREHLKTYEPMNLVYRKFVDMLGKYVDKFNKKDKFTLCGYNNASFDNPFLRAWFVQNGDNYFGSWFWSSSIDVMVMAHCHLMAQRPEMVDFKLKTVASKMGLQVDESKLHDGFYDIELTRGIYNLIRQSTTY
ncbi:3'-5' exonuclease [Albibacterium profundi]|uniref:3'-5' exonuclease n=1 Tax=Albibacterium profundi TaxID=3134906 RepID=A0ABV5CF77_9SPHI